MTRHARLAWTLAVAAACVAVVLASLLIGAEPISPLRAWREYRAGLSLAESPALSILVNQRLPRTLAAFLAGAGLALVGCVFQALLRNPLATPYTLGVASAGALGAWSAFLLVDAGWIGLRLLGVPSVQALAFLFALADVVVVYAVAAGRARPSPAVLLLAGVTMGMLANSGIMLTRYLAAPDRLVMMDRWLMGGVDVLGYTPVLALLLGVAPGAVVLLLLSAALDQLGFGEELAAGRGVSVRKVQAGAFFVGSFMTALVVSEVGPIGFVGLIVPHSVRALVGPRHRILLPASMLAGGAFLCCCDIVARRVLPGETPIGIITTLAGGPFFLYLLMGRRFTDWE